MTMNTAITQAEQACRRVETEAQLVVQFQLFVCHFSIYIVHDAKIGIIFISQAIFLIFFEIIFSAA